MKIVPSNYTFTLMRFHLKAVSKESVATSFYPFIISWPLLSSFTLFVAKIEQSTAVEFSGQISHRTRPPAMTVLLYVCRVRIHPARCIAVRPFVGCSQHRSAGDTLYGRKVHSRYNTIRGSYIIYRDEGRSSPSRYLSSASWPPRADNFN